jgi:hypothetical protein
MLEPAILLLATDTEVIVGETDGISIWCSCRNVQTLRGTLSLPFTLALTTTSLSLGSFSTAGWSVFTTLIEGTLGSGGGAKGNWCGEESFLHYWVLPRDTKCILEIRSSLY